MPSSSTVEITKDHVKEAMANALVDIVSHVASKPNEEVVGAILLDGTIHHLRNEARNRASEMMVSPIQLKDLDVVVIYHSHPDGSELPSVTDEAGLAPIPAAIVTHDAITLWWYADHIGYYRIWDRYYGVE